MKRARIVLAAPASGSGKTLITCAMLEAFLQRNKSVAAFKCGPDYIDPMFHQKVIGVPSTNLDLYFTNQATTRQLFLQESQADISIIEGVMGLYDGIGGVREEASTYHLAECLGAPVILVINARGMGRSILAMIKGFLDMDHEHLIKGLILNQVSKSFYGILKPLIEEELKVEVLGYYEKQDDLQLESRHLGLKLPNEVKKLKEKVVLAAKSLEESVNLSRIYELAIEAGELEECKSIACEGKKKVRIAVAKDQVFCFYYKENLKMLEERGAELIYFSPLDDKSLPEDIDGLILGGGYPELRAKELKENYTMRESIKTAISAGLPSLAECGGFMYLHKEIQLEDGSSYEGVGIIDGKCYYSGKLVRFGYMEIEDKASKMRLKGHEFHYFDSSNNGNDCLSHKPYSSKSWECAFKGERYWWGFGHLYYPSNPDFVDWFMDECMKWRNHS